MTITIEELTAKQEITEQILRYCRAIDRCDRSLLASVFHEDAMHDHGPYQGPSSQFCEFAMDLLHVLEYTMHQASNILIDMIDATNALTETYFSAYHRIAAGVEQAAFPDHDLSIDEDVWISGRYIDHFECRQGQWKIAKRYGIHDWVKWSPASDRGFGETPAEQRGQRYPEDRTYHLSVGKGNYALMYRDQNVKPI